MSGRLTSEDATYRSAQWQAFDQVLNYLNTLETKEVAKKDIYAAVMAMRPQGSLIEELHVALGASLVAMKIASALPGVGREYDFEPAIAEATKAYTAIGTKSDLGRTALATQRAK